MSSTPSRPTTDQIIFKLKPVFLSLLDACDYAADTSSQLWDFAVHIKQLTGLGFTETDLRWLAKRGWVDHAREVTVEGEDGRKFQPTGNLMFSRETCFVLTETGVAKAHSLFSDDLAMEVDLIRTRRHVAMTRPVRFDPADAVCDVPHWDADVRELRLNDKVIKRFKWQAVNQEIVLSVFQEEGWPPVIDDPLPPTPEQDPKRRLQDTIKSLNRNQENALMRFHGNGTGESVRWKFSEESE